MSNKLKLNSIGEEARLCRKAFKNVEVGVLVWHCHHERLAEFLTEPAENRIAYILRNKPEHERALRLHLFRPLNIKNLPAKLMKAHADWRKADVNWRKADADWLKADADWLKADADWLKADADREKAYTDWEKAVGGSLHKKQCKNCPWDGHTIFP